MVDHFGVPVDQGSYGDRYLLVFFGFTRCERVCPRELGKLERALELLGPQAARVQPLYVSVDPARDDPATMRACLEARASRFIGLTGSKEAVIAAKRAYRVYAEPVASATAPDGYVVPHTAWAYFMAPGGRYLMHFPEVLGAEEVAARIRSQLG